MSVNLELPLFERPFKQRVKEGWDSFAKGECELRQMMEENIYGDELLEKCTDLLSPAFEEVFFELGHNGEKYELILNLEGDHSKLFTYNYFQKRAPKEVLENWNIIVGRPPVSEKFELHIMGQSVSWEDFSIWTDWDGEKVQISLYCKKLVPLLKEDEGSAYQIAIIMLDSAIGELTEMNYISNLEVLKRPLLKKSMKMQQLMIHFEEHLSLGREELLDADRYCDLYAGYQMQPDEENTEGLRKDVFVGTTSCLPLLNDFMCGESYIMDSFHKEGVVAGYLYYPLFHFAGENRGAEILDFRDNITEQLENRIGVDAFSYIGGASGVHFGYLDFVAWDLKEVLDAIVEIFAKTEISWVAFHTFRQGVDSITVMQQDDRNEKEDGK